MMAKKCVSCGEVGGFMKDSAFVTISSKDYCPKCASQYLAENTSGIIMTTTHSIEGYSIIQYVSIESVEVVIGTGVISEFFGDVADVFGSRNGAFEQKLHKAKEIACSKLRLISFQKAGKDSAVVGIDMDYTEFTKNMIGVILNGTIVKIRKASCNNSGLIDISV